MFVVGTAGHVDHGKSALVAALTGIDPDRLREEKTRGMTIDLGFAWLTLPSGRSVSIIDVPGHERFIKNMLAGAGGIDLALLVVAADDGVMPQTREHLAILDLLGVRRGVVALTKRDLVDDAWLAMVQADIVETLRGTTIEGALIVVCSSVTRAGLDDVAGALDTAIAELPPKRDVGRPRLPIDRVFTIDGFGTVVTGTLIDGELATGAEIEATPGGKRGRVRGLQSHRDAVERALPGTRTAVNVTGIAKDDLRRGMVLTLPGTMRATDVVDARLRAVDGLAHPLRHNMRVTFHVHADEANGQLRLLDCDELPSRGEAWAQIKLDSPVAALRGDKFVIRTANDTVAGGVIVDATPKRHRRMHAPTLEALAALLSDRPFHIALDAIARHPMIGANALTERTGLHGESLESALNELIATEAIERVGNGASAWFAATVWVRERRDSAIATLAAYHANHPLRAGMPAEELRTRLGVDKQAFGFLAGTWADVRIDNAVAALTSHGPKPDASQQQAIAAYLTTLRASPASPPIDGAPDAEVLAYLVGVGAVVDAGDNVVFDAAAFAGMELRVREHIAQHNAITLAQARDLFGSSRRYMQAMLEELDRRRVTRRVGDERVLR